MLWYIAGFTVIPSMTLCPRVRKYRSWDSAVGTVTGRRDGRFGVWTSAGEEIFLSSKPSRITLRPTELHIQRVTGIFPWDRAARAWRRPLTSPRRRASPLPTTCINGADKGNFLDFKLSPCTECCMLSFGWFPGVWNLYADVSEHCSIFIGILHAPTCLWRWNRVFRNVGI